MQRKTAKRKGQRPRRMTDVLGLSKLRNGKKKLGAPPGSLVHVGERNVENAVITVVDYHPDGVIETVLQSPEQCLPFKETSTVTWINVDGLHDVKMIERFGQLFNIHPLILEDVLNTGQRGKIEEHEEHQFVALKSIQYDAGSDRLREEQVSIVCGRNYLISFQEQPSGLFQPIIDRLRNRTLKIRRRGVDYLMYALVDTVVDNGFGILEIIGEKLETLDDINLESVTQEHIQAVFDLKKKIFAMRKSIWPMREISSAVLKGEFDLVDDTTLIYFRDVNDHIIQIIEAIDVYREVVSSMIDTYLSTLSLRMNQVMKVLTIAASIFMPLTFIAGVYGMNFRFMPELEWRWGYFAILGTMLVLIILMLAAFRRKKWI